MNEQKIVKVHQAKFLVFWSDRPDSELIIDFNPLIDFFKLEGNFCLIHWQAKPKGLRKWGTYDRFLDSYFSFASKDISFGNIRGENIKMCEIDETIYTTKPTAVLIINNAKFITKEQGKFQLVEAL